ncbi:MAG TPA: helix-turn-helix domain-containing protein [Jiangellaceae bacterium]
MSKSATVAERPMRADARRNYERILDVARETFRELGAEAPMDEIARRAQVGPGTLYRHFPTREDLLAGALHRDMTALIERADALSSAPSAGAALTEWLRAFVTHVNVFRGLSASVCNAIRDPESPLHLPCESMVEAGGNLLVNAQAEGSVRPDLTAEELFIMANALSWAVDQAGADALRAERFLELLTDTLAPRPAR